VCFLKDVRDLYTVHRRNASGQYPVAGSVTSVFHHSTKAPLIVRPPPVNEFYDRFCPGPRIGTTPGKLGTPEASELDGGGPIGPTTLISFPRWSIVDEKRYVSELRRWAAVMRRALYFFSDPAGLVGFIREGDGVVDVDGESRPSLFDRLRGG